MKYYIYIAAILFVFTISSCGPNIVYEQEYVLGKSWTYDESAEFAFKISDPNQEYDLLLTVVHNPDFSHQNFYSNITTTFPTGEIFTDPLSIELANKMGSWLSSCNSNVCTLHLLLRDDVKFKDVGEYKIYFDQDTREAQLEGIQSLGLSLIEIEK